MTDLAPGSTVRLTELTACGGSAATWGAIGLRDLLAAWGGPAGPGGGPEPDGLLVGLAPFDGAQAFFPDVGRAFGAYVVLGSFELRDTLVPAVNQLLATVRIGPL